jgi:hypothetical protein
VSGLLALLGCVPRQELIDAGDLAVWDVGERVSQPSLGIDAVELGGLDQGAGDGGGAAAGLRADEQIVFPSDRNRSHRPLGRVGVQLQNAMVEIREL